MKQRIPSDYVNDVSKYNHNIAAGEFGNIHAGVAVPTKFRRMRIGDRVRGKIETLVQSQPFKGPLMQGFDIVTIATFTPDSVIHGWQDNGRQYTPEQYLDMDYWQFAALAPVRTETPLADQVDEVNLSMLGYYNYATMIPVTKDDYMGAWPYGKIGGLDASHEFLSAVGRGSLWDWIGVPAGASPFPWIDSSERPDFNASPEYMWPVMPVVAYALSCLYYFRNIQEDGMYFTLGLENMSDENSTAFNNVFAYFDPNKFLSELEQLHFESRNGIVNNATFEYANNVNPIPDLGWQAPEEDYQNLRSLCVAGLASWGGLFAVPYNPDLFGNIIKLGEAPVAVCPIVTTEQGDSIQIPDLRSANKEQLMLDRLYASGGRWDDVRATLFGKKGNTTSNKPHFVGVWKSTINPINTVATSAGQSSTQDIDLAQMGARLDTYSDYGGQEYIDYFAEENGVFMTISVIVPKPAYSQGLNPDLLVKAFGDDFNPEQNGEGFQSVPRSRFSLLPRYEADFVPRVENGLNPNNLSVADEVAWSWLKTDFSRLHGDFSSIGYYQWWTLHRDFTRFVPSSDRFYGDTITSYINPMDFQYLFEGISYQYANFTLMANVDLTLTNAVANNYMPFLGR